MAVNVNIHLRDIFCFLALLGIFWEVSMVSSRSTKDYSGYTLQRFTPTTERQLEFLKRLWVEGTHGEFVVDFWRPPGKLNRHVDILVSPMHRERFEALLKSVELHATHTSEIDLERQDDTYEEVQNDETGGNNTEFRVDNYNDLNAITEYLQQLASDYPDIMSVETIGTTLENRSILMAKDRLWRKNRRPSSNASCPGVDLNRNFAWHWATTGSSNSSCSYSFHGVSAFSEPETRAVRDFIMKHRSTIKAYITLHAYSQLWLLPYSHKNATYAANHYTELLPLAERAVAALTAVHGTEYTIGTAPDILYAASGGSISWAKGVAGVQYTYALELRPADGSDSAGFKLDRDQIVPTGEETMEAMLVVARQIIAQNPTTLKAQNVV